MTVLKADEKQVGGNHYKDLRIQPAEYCYKNGMGSLESGVVKYVTRWKLKGGFKDLEKAKHLIDMIMQYEEEMGHHWEKGND